MYRKHLLGAHLVARPLLVFEAGQPPQYDLGRVGSSEERKEVGAVREVRDGVVYLQSHIPDVNPHLRVLHKPEVHLGPLPHAAAPLGVHALQDLRGGAPENGR